MKATIGGTEVTIDKGSYYKVELMKEEYLLLSFRYPTLLPLSVGTTATAGGYSGVLAENYAPTYNAARGCYNYDVKFVAPYWRDNNKLVKLTGTNQTIFAVTDKPSNILAIIAGSAGWTVGTVDDTVGYVTIQFNGTHCVDALNALVKAMDDNGFYEWWFSGTTVSVGKLTGSGTAISLTEENVSGISASNSSGRTATKVYAMGGTKNMSPRVGLDAPNISATTAVMGYGYKDPLHEITAAMFKANARVYPVVQKLWEDTTSTAKAGVSYGDSVNVSLSAKEHASKAIDGVFNGKATVEFKSYNQVTVYVEATACQITEGQYRGTLWLVRGDTRLAKLDEITEHNYYGFLPNTPIPLMFRFNNVEDQEVTFDDSPIGVEVEVSFIDAKIETPEGQTGGSPSVSIRYTNGYLAFDVTSMDYYAISAGPLGRFNPKFLPISDPNSRVFSQSGTATIDQLGISRSKVPYSWFYESSKYKDGLIGKVENRLTCVIGTGTEEEQVVFDDIYPKIGGTLGTVGTFKSVAEKDSNGELTGRTQIYYSFETDLFDGLSPKDYIEDTAHIAFDKGSTLGGMEFEIAIVGQSDGKAEIAIIPNENYSQLIPNSVLFPKAGDKYSLYGLDAGIYDDGTAVASAQQELNEAAQAYLDRQKEDKGIYNCSIKATKAAALKSVAFGAAASLSFGGATLTQTRVIGIKRYLDLPEAGLEIMVGNSTPYRKLDYLERKLTVG